MRLIIIALLLVSCGKKDKDKPCLSRLQKMMECFQDYNETHDPYYVERVCGERYPQEGCYQ